ncbi:MAG: DUF1284 domain-containing protein [Chloroflexi bacterium]|nr:DUF1284 domain-containing protein [Chloroflexota bacterium]
MGNIDLRGHHFLCILGFRGHGYSPPFVENMWRVVDALRSSEAVVDIKAAPDAVCTACPFLAMSGCRKRNEQSETRVREHDGRILERLGLEPGDSLTWAEVMERIRANIAPEDVDELCADCEWLSLGYCREGVRMMKEGTVTVAEAADG